MSDPIPISHPRLRSGRLVKTDADYQLWLYEGLDDIVQDISQNCTPIQAFPAFSRVMLEWCDGLRGCGADRENALALARVISELTGTLKICLDDMTEAPAPDPESPR